jgi:hypothetical protein
MGSRRRRQTANSLRVCSSTPLRLSSSMIALSAAVSARYVSSEKSSWPGVSSRFTRSPACSNWSTLAVIEIPRSFSISIQSEVACRDARRALTEPARWIAPL